MNALGPDLNDDKNYNDEIFAYYMFDVEYDGDQYIEQSSPDTIILFAYLKAMNSYLDVTDALTFSNLAVEKDPNSLAINMINALILAQTQMEGSGCAVYQTVDRVRENPAFINDLKPEAIEQIFSYINGYQSYCN